METMSEVDALWAEFLALRCDANVVADALTEALDDAGPSGKVTAIAAGVRVNYTRHNLGVAVTGPADHNVTVLNVFAAAQANSVAGLLSRLVPALAPRWVAGTVFADRSRYLDSLQQHVTTLLPHVDLARYTIDGRSTITVIQNDDYDWRVGDVIIDPTMFTDADDRDRWWAGLDPLLRLAVVHFGRSLRGAATCRVVG